MWKWRWLIFILLVLILAATWDYHRQFNQLREKDAILGRDLQALTHQNRRLQAEITDGIIRDRKIRWEIEAVASILRGLSFRDSIPYQRKEREMTKAALIYKFGIKSPFDEFRNRELAFKRMGLLPMEGNLMNILPDFFSNQLTSFYHPESHELYVLPSLNLVNDSEKVALLHELVHVLQDQNFDLNALVAKAQTNDDAAMALLTLSEGDADYHASLYLKDYFEHSAVEHDLQFPHLFLTEKMGSMPAYVKAELVFPFQAGRRFVSEVYARGGIAAVNEAFKNPPQSTEQIMHPEKYYGVVQDIPKPVVWSFKADANWKKLHENVVGEFGVSVLFSEVLGAEKALKIAAGWGGDRYVLYEVSADKKSALRDTKWVLVWKSIWDTEKDAREFFDALEDFYQNRYGVEDHVGRSKSELAKEAVFFSWANQKQCMVIRGKNVLFLDAPDAKCLGRLLPELMKGM